MLAQIAQVPIQFLHPLFVRLGPFALEPFVELPATQHQLDPSDLPSFIPGL